MRGEELEFIMEGVTSPGDVPLNNRIDTVESGTTKTLVNLDWTLRGNLWKQGAAGPLNQKEFLWMDDDRLAESKDGPPSNQTKWRFAYDAAGERVIRWHDGGSGIEATAFIRNEEGQVISEWDYLTGGSGFDVRKDYITVGSNTIAEIDHLSHLNEIWNVATDHLGSTRVLFDETGNIIDEYEYLPFGALDGHTGIPGTPHLFTGHERDLGDGSSELDFMHQRYYSNQLARFVSVDPVLGSTGSSQSWNRYSYVENNPVGFVDPTGMMLDVPNTMTGGAFGKKPFMVGDATPEQGAMTYSLLAPLVALTAGPAIIGAVYLFSPAAAEGMLLAAGVSSWTSIKPSLTSSQPVDQQIRSNLLSISAATPFGAVPVPSPAKAFLSNTVASLTSNSLITGNSMPSEGASYSAIGQGISGGLATAITGGNSAFAVPLQIILDWAIGGFFSSPEDTGKAQRVNEHLFRKEGGGWVWAEPGT